MTVMTVLDFVNVFFAGMLAGIEFVIHYGVREPAEAAGLEPGDVIVLVDTTPTRTADDLASAIMQSSQDHVAIFVFRGKEMRQVEVNLGKH